MLYIYICILISHPHAETSHLASMVKKGSSKCTTSASPRAFSSVTLVKCTKAFNEEYLFRAKKNWKFLEIWIF